jgi:hypothetical protein
MKVLQRLWTPATGWFGKGEANAAAQLVFAFGSSNALRQAALFAQIRAWHPAAIIVGCSTAGEILDAEVHEDSLAVTAVQFGRSTVDWAWASIADSADGSAAARQVASALIRPGLRHVFILCDGLAANGTAVARTLQETLPAGVTATGGLAADADRFAETFVMANELGERQRLVGVGFYGDSIRVGFGSLGGWDCFGPARRITRSQGKVLFELDGQSALGLYKAYLGDQAAGLPATALSFPLLLEDDQNGPGLVRAVLAVSEVDGSLTFGGDMPEGGRARLMRANADRLVDGASGAAAAAAQGIDGTDTQLAILISCIGRKLVLRQRVEEEIEIVHEALPLAALTGFYSYGELCPQSAGGGCVLHNETMTITTIAEA